MALVDLAWIVSSWKGLDLFTRTGKSHLTPPVGSLHYITTRIELVKSKIDESFSGQMKIEIFNTTSKLIYFEASTAGNINGIAFATDRVNFSGNVFPGKATYLVSARLTKILPSFSPQEQAPTFQGIYEYDLKYRYSNMSKLSRLSRKGIRMDCWNIDTNKPSATIEKRKTTVFLYIDEES